MKRLGLVGLALLLLLLPHRAGAAPQPQVIDDFGSASWDGRPNGWEALGFGATAKVSHLAEAPAAMRVEYTFNQPQGVVYLLGRSRLRGLPFNIEMTLRSNDGRELVGVLLEDGISGKIYEVRSKDALTQEGWVTRAIEPKQEGVELQTLPGGGGLRILGLTVRQSPGGPASGTIDFDELLASCEVTPEQAAMIDIITGRQDGVFAPNEEPRPELMVTAVAGERQNFQVSYTVTDGDGNQVGQGNETADVGPGRSQRIPVKYTPRKPYGFFKIEAAAKAAKSERHATARICQVPEVPAGDGRQIGVVWRPDSAAPWHDVLLLQALQRAGIGAARVELSWQDTEKSRGQRSWPAFDQVIATARMAGVPLLVAVVDPPGWAVSGGRADLAAPLTSFVTDAVTHAGDQAIGWELLREPNNPRYWPPEPQPFAYRMMLQTVGAAIQAKQPQAIILNGALRGFEHGFTGTLVTGSDDPVTAVGLSTPPPARAFPFLDQARPSDGLVVMLTDYRDWLKNTGRPYVAPWLVNIGVRTSPLEESKQGQAAELERAAILASAAGGRLFWHTAKDGDESDDRYGLMRRNLEPKPAVAALAAVAARTYGAKFLGSPAGQSNPLYVFSTPQGFVAASWSNSRGTLSASGDAAGYDGWGNGTNSGSAPLGSLPAYLVGKGVTSLLAGR